MSNIGYGCSGSGGRIAIYANYYDYVSRLRANAGSGGNYFGGPGLIYLSVGGNSSLYIGSVGAYSADTTISSFETSIGTAWLIEPNISSFKFDLIAFTGYGGLAILDNATAPVSFFS